MATKTTGMSKKGSKKSKGKTLAVKYSDTVNVVLNRDCAEELYAALVIGLGTLPSPKKKKKGKGKKDKGKGGKGGKGGKS